MAANITRIPVLKHSPLHRIFASLTSDWEEPVHIQVTLNMSGIAAKDPEEWATASLTKTERILVERLHYDRHTGNVTFSGTARKKVGVTWRKKYACAGKLSFGGKGDSWLVDLETDELFTDCTDSPLPGLWWRRAMIDANKVIEDLVGDRHLGSEIVRRTVDTLSRGMRRLPNICPDCGQAVTRSDFGSQLATCPTHGQLDYGGDMVIAIGRFEEAFDIKTAV